MIPHLRGLYPKAELGNGPATALVAAGSNMFQLSLDLLALRLLCDWWDSLIRLHWAVEMWYRWAKNSVFLEAFGCPII